MQISHTWFKSVRLKSVQHRKGNGRTHLETMHIPGGVGVEGMLLLLKSGFISKQQLREFNMAKLQASLEIGLNRAY